MVARAEGGGGRRILDIATGPTGEYGMDSQKRNVIFTQGFFPSQEHRVISIRFYPAGRILRERRAFGFQMKFVWSRGQSRRLMASPESGSESGGPLGLQGCSHGTVSSRSLGW